MRNMVTVVDDFYRNPVEVINQARQEHDWLSEGTSRLLHETRRTTKGYFDDKHRKLIELTGESHCIKAVDDCGYFAVSSPGVERSNEPEVSSSTWTGILCLSLEKPVSARMSFYGQTQGIDHPIETLRVPMHFNRLVIFRSDEVPFNLFVEDVSSSKSELYIQVFKFNRLQEAGE